jgi:alpha-D-ribose 1-methylphosphonate 5-triphosphate synthase subunit PhnG
MTVAPHASAHADRRNALAILVEATVEELTLGLAKLGNLPAARDLRAPEIGLIMVRGRIGGDGAPFNLGEATVARAALVLDTGEIGHGHVLGRDKVKARLVALCDALGQSDEHAEALQTHVIAPVRARLEAERKLSQARVAATKVDFFTVARGGD